MVESEGNGGQAVTRSGRSDFRLPPRYHPVALWQLGTFRAGTRAMPWESSTAGDGITATLLQSWGYRRHLFRPVLSGRSAEHTSELQSLMRISYAVFCLTKKKQQT